MAYLHSLLLYALNDWNQGKGIIRSSPPHYKQLNRRLEITLNEARAEKLRLPESLLKLRYKIFELRVQVYTHQTKHHGKCKHPKVNYQHFIFIIECCGGKLSKLIIIKK